MRRRGAAAERRRRAGPRPSAPAPPRQRRRRCPWVLPFRRPPILPLTRRRRAITAPAARTSVRVAGGDEQTPFGAAPPTHQTGQVTTLAAQPLIPVPQVLEGPVVRLEPLTRDALPELFT